MKTPVDYTGFRPDVPGSLLVGVRPVGKRLLRGYMREIWLWQCDCGGQVEDAPCYVTGGRRKSCGCLLAKSRTNLTPNAKGERRKPVRDITGQRFGRLVALHELPERRGERVLWLFRCDCGNEKAIPSCHVTAKRTFSCGCQHRESMLNNFKKGALLSQAKAAAKRNPLAAGLLPHLMPTINHQQAQRVNLLGDE